MPVVWNLLKPLAKSVLIPLGLTTAATATDTDIHKKMFWSGSTTLIIQNEEMNDILRIAKSHEGCGLLVKGVSLTIKNEAKEQKEGFLRGMVLENLLTVKGVTATMR